MASVLLASLAGLGSAGHLVTVAAGLRDRGHRVSVVTEQRALDGYRPLGLDLHPVPEPAMPELSQKLPPVVQRATQLFTRVQRNIIDPLPLQWVVVERVIEDAAVDVVVTDGLFLGGSMLAARPRTSRPGVVMLGCFPPWLTDPLVPPYGMGFSPTADGMDRIRAAAFELVAARAYALLSRSFNRQVEATLGVRRTGDLRSSPELGDVWAQLTVPRFEYPRNALPGNFRFIGPLHPADAGAVPEWWSPTEEPPVVAVRADGDRALQDLVEPTIRAFGGTTDTVIIAGVTRAAVAATHPGPLPGNVHFEDHLPWSRLIASRTVVVSDGDYLHAQHALRHGAPLVVAGTLETSVETAARVSWTGAGIDLRLRRPSPAAIRSAVERVRADDSYRAAAARVAAQIATTDAEATICDLAEQHAR